jgi:hypothetical protein
MGELGVGARYKTLQPVDWAPDYRLAARPTIAVVLYVTERFPTSHASPRVAAAWTGEGGKRLTPMSLCDNSRAGNPGSTSDSYVTHAQESCGRQRRFGRQPCQNEDMSGFCQTLADRRTDTHWDAMCCTPVVSRW